MHDLTEFQQRACAVAVVKLFKARYFDICNLDAIAKTMGRDSSLAGRDYAALRAVHCIDWADMGPELTRMTRDKCLELLGMPPQTIEMVEPVHKDEPSEAPAKRIRLAWWSK